MKNKTSNKKNFLSKLFIKIIRKFGYEVIDQSNLSLPSSNLSANDNLSKSGFKSITVPLGATKITNKINSLTIIIRSYTFGESNGNQVMLDQNKKRIFDAPKIEYTLRTINSIIKSCTLAKEYFKNLKIRIIITDDNSNE
ncbi:MAG: rhamnosyl transferase, partial [Candidatus Pelagibacter sp.]|nr:rhamnosyl transferase [Candidatus Pelagibacter sp.]